MKKLIGLEWRVSPYKRYMLNGIILGVFSLGFLYLLAYAPHIEPKDDDLKLFAGYENLISLFGVLHMSFFAIFGAVVHSKAVVEAYDIKRRILLFSYPQDRQTMYVIKLMAAAIFIFIMTLMTGLVAFAIFSMSENSLHLTGSGFTLMEWMQAGNQLIVSSVLAVAIATISSALGIKTASVPTTIITAVVASSLICNIAMATLGNAFAILMATIVIALATLCVVLYSMNLVTRMEVA